MRFTHAAKCALLVCLSVAGAACSSRGAATPTPAEPAGFFFVEPGFDIAADPDTRYVARWPDAPTLAGLMLDSLRFVDVRTVEFRAVGGDGGYGVEEVWRLDVVTGATTLQSRVEHTTKLP